MSKETDETLRIAKMIPAMLGIFMIIFTVWMVALISTSTWNRDELHTLQRQIKTLEQKCKVTP